MRYADLLSVKTQYPSICDTLPSEGRVSRMTNLTEMHQGGFTGFMFCAQY